MDLGCDAPKIRAFGLLLEAHAALVATIGRELQEASGLPLTWFEVLIRLARSPGQRLRMSFLAGQVALSASGLTRVVDQAETAGLLRREVCPSDRRGAYAVLTEAGARVLAESLPAHVASLERWMSAPLGAEGLEKLAGMLETLRDGLRAGEAPSGSRPAHHC